jgi:hypothetical protein
MNTISVASKEDFFLLRGSTGLLDLAPDPDPLTQFKSVIIRIRIHMFLGLPDPDPVVRGMGPDPSISTQK